MNRIKDLRHNLGLTQKHIADKLGCNQTAIGKYEREKLEPNIDVLWRLADYFNCSIDYLVGRENDFGIISSSADGEVLSSEEKELLTSFRKLDAENKQRVIGYCYARGI